MNAAIRSIEYYLPENLVTNADLQKQYPGWDFEKIDKKTGVLKRYIAAPDETAFDLSVKACEKLFASYDKEQIDGIIYCTQSPDYIMPSNSFLLQKHFQLPGNAFAFDFNHACTGYIYGLMMAKSFIKSGVAKHILLVNADTYSKYIHPADRSTRVLFGDGAAATIIEACDDGMGVIDIELATHGAGFDKFMIPAGGARLPKSADTAIETTDQAGNTRSQDNIKMDGLAVWAFINSKVPAQVKDILQRNHLSIEDLDLVIFHQASKMTLDSLIKTLKLQEDKLFINLSELGNTVSASIPIAIKDAMNAGKIKAGQTILLSGFGVGLSYGAALLKT